MHHRHTRHQRVHTERPTPSTGCKYARLCTFSSYKAIFQDKMILNLLLLELRSSFFHIFFVFLNIIQVKSL